MNKFLITVIFIVASVFAYLGLRLRDSSELSWIFLGLLLSMVALLPLSFLLGREHLQKLKGLRWVIYLSMGYLSFLLVLTVLRDVLFLPLSWLQLPIGALAFSGAGSVSIMVASGAAVLFGTWNALRGARVVKVEVPCRNLPPGLNGFRIVQISDLHIGPTILRSATAKVVEQVLALSPDLIALTGDIVDGAVPEFKSYLEPFAQLGQTGRAFYVTGNHEYYWNAPLWLSEFSSLKIQPLLNANQILTHQGEKILVAGVIDPAARMLQTGAKPDLSTAIKASEASSFKILLAHQPGIAEAAAKEGFDLQLSGHTHAGQFFPWTFVVRRMHRFSHGLKQCGKMWVYVNAGTGSWGPPIRLGTNPEITLLTLRPS